MQRISDLEARLATALADNEQLRANGNGNGHLDLEKLIEKLIGKGFDRFGQDYTGKLAGLIQPFIENTIRRCKETEEQQTAIEERFKRHEAAVSKSAGNMIAAFNALHEDAKNDWQAQRDLIQSDFTQVDKFAKWFRAELDKNGKENAKAVTDCQTAARACQALTQKVSEPVDETMRHLEEIQAEGETAIKRAAQRLTKTYENLQRPVLWIASGFLALTIIFMLAMGWIILKRAQTLQDSNLQELAGYSEEQKTEMRGLFDQAMAEAKESQIDREVKVKMWDELMKTLTPQQRQTG